MSCAAAACRRIQHVTGRTFNMRLIDKRPCVDRRTFLSGGTVAAVGSALISAPAMKQAKADIYEQSFPKLGMDTGKLLVRIARDIYPYVRLRRGQSDTMFG